MITRLCGAAAVLAAAALAFTVTLHLHFALRRMQYLISTVG